MGSVAQSGEAASLPTASFSRTLPSERLARCAPSHRCMATSAQRSRRSLACCASLRDSASERKACAQSIRPFEIFSDDERELARSTKIFLARSPARLCTLSCTIEKLVAPPCASISSSWYRSRNAPDTGSAETPPAQLDHCPAGGFL